MRQFIVRLQRFIEELRASPEPRKRRWLWMLSGSSMAIVVTAWLLYVSASFPTLPPPVGAPQRAAAPPPASAEPRPGFGATFLAGVSVVADRAGLVVSRLVEAFQRTVGAPNEITIESAPRNFIMEGLLVVPPTTLP